eukprot:3686197-Pyramimonas_sp.AAC.1
MCIVFLLHTFVGFAFEHVIDPCAAPAYDGHPDGGRAGVQIGRSREHVRNMNSSGKEFVPLEVTKFVARVVTHDR